MPAEDGRVAVEPLLRALGERDVISVLLEGGMTLTASFLKAGLVDKAYFFVRAQNDRRRTWSKGVVGDLGVTRMDECRVFERIAVRRFDDDLMIESYPAPQFGRE